MLKDCSRLKATNYKAQIYFVMGPGSMLKFYKRHNCDYR